MLISHARRIQWRGKPADLRVLRNNGYCWGLIVDGNRAYDVSTYADHYEWNDEDALDAFEAASRSPTCIEASDRQWDAKLLEEDQFGALK